MRLILNNKEGKLSGKTVELLLANSRVKRQKSKLVLRKHQVGLISNKYMRIDAKNLFSCTWESGSCIGFSKLRGKVGRDNRHCAGTSRGTAKDNQLRLNGKRLI